MKNLTNKEVSAVAGGRKILGPPLPSITTMDLERKAPLPTPPIGA
jgi:hypothetical protein